MFIKFDIADFYPAISEDLLYRAIGYPRNITAIEDKVIDAINSLKNRYYLVKKKNWINRGENRVFCLLQGKIRRVTFYSSIRLIKTLILQKIIFSLIFKCFSVKITEASSKIGIAIRGNSLYKIKITSYYDIL